MPLGAESTLDWASCSPILAGGAIPQDEPALGAGYALLQFGLGGHQQELSLIDRRYADAVPAAPGSAVLYWHADDLAGAVRELLAVGRASTSRSTSAARGSASSPPR
ncbi:hypothetical protein [Micromonospora sp. RTP1Z1]|uniref:hypothetical protein n=1 Tax=Micromonospora sp. RTP1Z1 TaxID=2994043 RepID=UPI0029C69412|nr:hypothetical protein [Micromonospora sp. RTP1Z1]